MIAVEFRGAQMIAVEFRGAQKIAVEFQMIFPLYVFINGTGKESQKDGERIYREFNTAYLDAESDQSSPFSDMPQVKAKTNDIFISN
ncbi:hypothetical protein STEG23_015291 [Scotinomys teguina]